jgi:CRISPR-associated protein Cmr4
MITTGLFLYTESSLHAGVGSTVSVVDLPIQRERTTQYPIVQGSGIKGALRSQIVEGIDGRDAYIKLIFGGEEPDTQDNNSKVNFAGAISVGDARIVLFPVRSLAGVFAYVTCPAVLARIARDLPEFPKFDGVIDSESALVTNQSDVSVSGVAVLEEFSFTARVDPQASSIAEWLAAYALPASDEYAYWRAKVQTSLVILNDNAFRDFVQNSTEIVTRVRLKSATKTVDEGALWTQEMLPADTLLMSAVVVRYTRSPFAETYAPDTVVQWLHNPGIIPNRIQLGGDETTGQGLVALRWA